MNSHLTLACLIVIGVLCAIAVIIEFIKSDDDDGPTMWFD